MGTSKVGDLTQQATVALLAPALYQLQVKYTEAERPPVVPERHLSRGLTVSASLEGQRHKPQSLHCRKPAISRTGLRTLLRGRDKKQLWRAGW